jgi:hypothetical protein
LCDGTIRWSSRIAIIHLLEGITLIDEPEMLSTLWGECSI